MDKAGERHSTQLINKEGNRSEIWNYFADKTDEKGKPTDLTISVCKH